MKNVGATFLPLWGNFGVMVRGKTWEKGPHLPSQKTQEEWKKAKARKKKQNRKLQTEAEKIQEEGDIEAMERRVIACNAAKRHLATFIALIHEGIELRQTIAICTFRKRAKEKDMVKEWARIRRWVTSQKETPHCAIAITIGRDTKGWYFLRCIAIGENMTVSHFLYALGHYLTDSRRKWHTNAVLLNEEWNRWLSYYQYEGATIEETICHFLDELFGVYRTSLMVERRTYKNQHTIDILERRAEPVPYKASFPVTAPNIEGNSRAGVSFCEVEWNRGRIAFAWDIGGEQLAEEEEVEQEPQNNEDF